MAAAKRSRDKDGSELALFLDMLSAERGAAAHTIEAYTRDLSEFLAFLAAKGQKAKTASADHLRAFLAGLARKGLAPTSRAQKALGHPPVLPLSPRRRHPQRRSLLGHRQSQARTSAAQDPVARRGRDPARHGQTGERAGCRRHRQAPRAQTLRGARDALCHRLARVRTDRAAAQRAYRRRPGAHHQGQRRPRAAGPVERDGARGAASPSRSGRARARPRGGEPRLGCSRQPGVSILPASASARS